ncbi:hypothetical protein ASE16_15490 [Leifsonia sp. Root227]|nr:hypothetical protein ASE16_15490 [Leifsonia sp. Root227]
MSSAQSIGTSLLREPIRAARLRMVTSKYILNPLVGPPPRLIVCKILVNASLTSSSGSIDDVIARAAALPALAWRTQSSP